MIENKKGKIIFLDYGMFLHRSIFVWEKYPQMPVEYNCLNMIISCLRKVGVSPYDTIIVACDKGRSWRRDIVKEYKADRKEKRQAHEGINWKVMYKKMDDLLEKIDEGTSWHIVQAQGLEADDWMAGGSRYYKDNEVVLVTFDADMEQLVSYPNVRLFSPIIKYKGSKGAYKIVKNPYEILAKKIQKESADNLNNPIVTEKDFEQRKIIVSLLELPDFIENIIIQRLDDINTNGKISVNSDILPYKILRDKIGRLYNDTTKIINYEECINRKPQKKKKTKKKRKKKNV